MEERGKKLKSQAVEGTEQSKCLSQLSKVFELRSYKQNEFATVENDLRCSSTSYPALFASVVDCA